MISIRRSDARGLSEQGWLRSRHTFSFADYHDRRFMGFRDLRVINEDRVEPGQGFGTHPHSDMEIVSYVLEGALAHRDSLGNGSLIRPGDVQRMSAGTGVHHSEFNPSEEEGVHFLQIWILPARRGTAPSYEQKRFGEEERRNQLRLVVAPDGAGGAVQIGQDTRIYAGLLDAGATVNLPLAPGRYAWVQVARGELELAGDTLQAGDGAAVSEQAELGLGARSAAEVLVFDLK
jgi:redox-sensitive bicupin YhaK (pirin superfamily)